MAQIIEIKSPVKTIITLDDDSLTIQRKGFLATHEMKGEKRLFYKNISALQMKEATLFSNGFLQFTLSGSSERRGVFSLATDENTIMFVKNDSSKMQLLKNQIEEKIRKASSSMPPPVIIAEKSVAGQIKEFKELLDSGIISEDEFNQKKKQLLNI
jgi:hypothetical protein